MKKDDLIKELIKYGKKAVNSGLTYANLGNISARLGDDEIIITKTGTDLSELDYDSFVTVDINSNHIDKSASVETIVHKEIYKLAKCFSIFHIHGAFSAGLSAVYGKSIEPIDLEGLKFLGDIPIIDGESGTKELGVKLGEALQNKKVAVNRLHGIFSRGKSVKEAFINASIAEHSSKLLFISQLFRNK